MTQQQDILSVLSNSISDTSTTSEYRPYTHALCEVFDV